MKNYFHANIQDKDDFILYNKGEGKWYNNILKSDKFTTYKEWNGI